MSHIKVNLLFNYIVFPLEKPLTIYSYKSYTNQVVNNCFIVYTLKLLPKSFTSFLPLHQSQEERNCSLSLLQQRV
jgi:hypothetical protein